jgi:5,10-methylene-tetrahydrofolate dehydrogenase/methenyl tetrahydrofolate cyclohydrolase
MGKFVKLGKHERQAGVAWVNIDHINHIDTVHGMVIHMPFTSFATEEEILKIIKLANMPDTDDLPAETPHYFPGIDFSSILKRKLDEQK